MNPLPSLSRAGVDRELAGLESSQQVPHEVCNWLFKSVGQGKIGTGERQTARNCGRGWSKKHIYGIAPVRSKRTAGEHRPAGSGAVATCPECSPALPLPGHRAFGKGRGKKQGWGGAPSTNLNCSRWLFQRWPSAA